MTFSEYGRKGGLASAKTSPRKRDALQKLFAARRGKRIHDLNTAELSRALARLKYLCVHHRKNEVISYRAAAKAAQVDEKTIRRWVAGIDHPAPAKFENLKRWLKTIR